MLVVMKHNATESDIGAVVETIEKIKRVEPVVPELPSAEERVKDFSDFERGFIRAEVTSFDDFIACGGEHGAREAGKLRLEGKDYITREGDIMYFRFNV